MWYVTYIVFIQKHSALMICTNEWIRISKQGVLTFLMFSWSLSSSQRSLCGIISIPENILLINVDPSLYENIIVGACFATTACTIISGAGIIIYVYVRVSIFLRLNIYLCSIGKNEK